MTKEGVIIKIILTVVISMKQISSRFSIAVHILTFIASVRENCTGDFIAASVNSNPVIVRNIMAMLKKAGLIGVRPGVGGAYLTKEAEEITLLDVYRAVDVIEDDKLFGFHKPQIACEIGKTIETTLREELRQAQEAMEQRLKIVTIQQILDQPDRKKLTD
ncbi:DNA-binding transcriptional regulator, IscR family [Evansella caseinilytica]|uniref:DNA-binding transcriptional regulator, IscR family n=1 Tax=Evansella caseinilytica TaxID=1503961 RepID=A0A1H3SMR3_9BACI|nr:DNA-binding transcriptional regulator, IscR family [Evansella caseinilytica]